MFEPDNEMHRILATLLVAIFWLEVNVRNELWRLPVA